MDWGVVSLQVIGSFALQAGKEVFSGITEV
jgi:hypothetical protein